MIHMWDETIFRSAPLFPVTLSSLSRCRLAFRMLRLGEMNVLSSLTFPWLMFCLSMLKVSNQVLARIRCYRLRPLIVVPGFDLQIKKYFIKRLCLIE